MNIEKELESIGLSEKEAKVYRASLEIGNGTASEIAIKSGVNRATTYFTLENLMKKGLISASNNEKKQIFFAENPSQIQKLLTKQKWEIEQKEKTVKTLVKKLASISANSTSEPLVKYYLGKEGIIRMAKSCFSQSQGEEMWLAFSQDNLESFLDHDQVLIQKRKKEENKTKLRSLYNTSKSSEKNTRHSLYFPVSTKKHPLPGDIAVFKDSIRLTSYTDKIGILIKNKDIAQTLITLFKLAIKNSSEK